MKYLRLLRLQDQYVEIVAVVSAGLFLGGFDLQILWWAIGCVCLSIPAYIVNEMVDRNDADKGSWNPVHIGSREQFNPHLVRFLFIAFSVLGFFLSWAMDMLGWGLAIWVIGLMYSLEPFRLKRRFAWDLLAQVSTWWILPFLAATWTVMQTDFLVAFVIITSGIILPVLFAYQLADIEGDAKAKLGSTHVILGMSMSLRSGLCVGLATVLLYVLFGLYRWAMWTIPLCLMLVFVLGLYLRWMGMKTVSMQTRDIQWWVMRVKPLTQIYALGLLVFWYFFG